MNISTPNEALPGDEIPSSEPSFGDILSEFEREQHKPASKPDEPAQTVGGTVVSITADGIFVDLGRKHEGILDPEPFKDAAGQVRLKSGDHVQVSVGGRDTNGYYVLSVLKVVIPKDWSGLQKAFDEKAIISGTVQEVIKGGLKVDVGARAFLPASRSGARDQGEMEKLVGQTIECRITKLDTEKEDVVVDRRGILEERAAAAKQAAFDGLAEGTVVNGTVRSVMDFGAFVDLGGVDGLLHVAEMSWLRGVKPSDVAKSGDTVQVKILRVDREKRKVSLSLKALQPEPFTQALQTIQQGQRIRGKVARVTDFGAFVELQPGVEGLIHISEMSWSRKQKRPQDIVKVGDVVDVIVLGIKPEERRISLTLKQTLGDPWEECVQKYPVGSIVEAPIANLAPFGAFLELAEGVEGMIHIGDIVNGKRLQHPKEALSAGQIVRAQVLEVDKGRRQFRLGMKQLEPTSADEYIAERKVGDLVTGRVMDAGASSAKVELGDGVKATCRLKAAAVSEPAAQPSADMQSSIAALAAKWKAGAVANTGSSGPSLRAGEVRQFRITSLDPSKKLIEVELAE
ncbi:MAG: S1 RNA-binding domain-containing protein [Bryobacteraceae bacterium]